MYVYMHVGVYCPHVNDIKTMLLSFCPLHKLISAYDNMDIIHCDFYLLYDDGYILNTEVTDNCFSCLFGLWSHDTLNVLYTFKACIMSHTYRYVCSYDYVSVLYEMLYYGLAMGFLQQREVHGLTYLPVSKFVLQF